MNSEQRVRVQDYVAGAFEAVWKKGQGTYKKSILRTAVETGKSISLIVSAHTKHTEAYKAGI